jgi:sec-independent protein translocase protein TatA
VSYQVANLIMVIGIEWIIIIVVIVMLFLGVKKIPQLARSFGKASAEFQKSKIEASRELERLKYQTDVSNIDREKLETIADTLGIDYSNKNDEELRNAINKEMDSQGSLLDIQSLDGDIDS